MNTDYLLDYFNTVMDMNLSRWNYQRKQWDSEFKKNPVSLKTSQKVTVSVEVLQKQINKLQSNETVRWDAYRQEAQSFLRQLKN